MLYPVELQPQSGKRRIFYHKNMMRVNRAFNLSEKKQNRTYFAKANALCYNAVVYE